MTEGTLHQTRVKTVEMNRVFTAQMKGGHLHLGTAREMDAPPEPGCVLTPAQAETLAKALKPGQRFGLRGVEGGVQLYTWGNLHLTSLKDGVDGKDHWASYHVKGHHAALATLIRNALNEAAAETVPADPQAQERAHA